MKTGAGEYILGVTRPNGECFQNLVFNPVSTAGKCVTYQEVSCIITRSPNHCSPVHVRLQRQALMTCAVHCKIEMSAISAGQQTPAAKASCTHAQNHMSKKTRKKVTLDPQL